MNKFDEYPEPTLEHITIFHTEGVEAASKAYQEFYGRDYILDEVKMFIRYWNDKYGGLGSIGIFQIS